MRACARARVFFAATIRHGTFRQVLPVLRVQADLTELRRQRTLIAQELATVKGQRANYTDAPRESIVDVGDPPPRQVPAHQKATAGGPGHRFEFDE
eukprot:COSAG05_NODE_203_length_14207_cov_24.645379_6_plen_96_part_00